MLPGITAIRLTVSVIWFSIKEIYENIWKEEALSADNTVAVHISHIREKIEINPKEPRYLKVVWGIGYKIENGKKVRVAKKSGNVID